VGDQWLNTFIYKQSMDVLIFIGSVLVLMLITLLAVGFETYKAAVSDPIKAIRHE